MANCLPLNIAGGREGAIGQRPFSGVILQDAGGVFEDRPGCIFWPLCCHISRHEPALAEALR